MYLNYILCVSLLFVKKYFYALLYITWLFIVGKIFYIFYILYFVFNNILIFVFSTSRLGLSDIFSCCFFRKSLKNYIFNMLWTDSINTLPVLNYLQHMNSIDTPQVFHCLLHMGQYRYSPSVQFPSTYGQYRYCPSFQFSSTYGTVSILPKL
ncbi:hypothetical protein KUTeg_003728 [Tegillarca granosa]|uniref:Uncharacterized protein n=1 Tax=Tegillarca granosa TaxID=220873 RepID=A0ABQ9FMY2_TEGGR|nr:hypothetical protein KUTeg_003728 [Tegillarca granosa]